ncbi:hypothetical protein NP118_23745 [Salmonella enterica]|nr:hypothetical protein [Salmonella enterica]
MVIEAYSPCRFSRKFGFYQDIPNDLGKEIPEANLANVLRLWRICTQRETLSQVYLPARATKPHTQVTQRYRSWWLAKHGNYLEEGIQKLVDSASPLPSKPKFPKKVGNDNGGKRIRMFEPGEFCSKDNDGSQSSSDDHHWKRSKKSKQPSVCEDEYFDGVPSSSQFPALPTLLVSVFIRSSL